MGMRIKKEFGYALTDVKTTDQWKIADERINADSFLLEGERRPKAEYVEFLKNADDGTGNVVFEISILNALAKPDFIEPGHVCTWDPEDGKPEVLLLKPAWCVKEWTRHDSDIDYIEHRLNYGPEGMEPQVRQIPFAPSAFRGYMDRITGKRCKETVWTWWQMHHASKKTMTPDEAGALDILSQEMGYKDFAEAKDRVIPIIPDDVRHLAEWGELFTGPDVWKQLRPVLYTYWT